MERFRRSDLVRRSLLLLPLIPRIGACHASVPVASPDLALRIDARRSATCGHVDRGLPSGGEQPGKPAFSPA